MRNSRSSTSAQTTCVVGGGRRSAFCARPSTIAKIAPLAEPLPSPSPSPSMKDQDEEVIGHKESPRGYGLGLGEAYDSHGEGDGCDRCGLPDEEKCCPGFWCVLLFAAFPLRAVPTIGLRNIHPPSMNKIQNICNYFSQARQGRPSYLAALLGVRPSQ